MKTVILIMAGLILSSQAQSSRYLIAPGRAIEVDIKGISLEESQKIKGTYPVSEHGLVSLPHLPALKAGGLTASEFAAVVESAYRKDEIYRDPKVLIIHSSSNGKIADYTVTIGGQVKRPGQVKFTQGMTVYQALQGGGGATEFGSMFRVNLIRSGKARVLDLTRNENKNLLVEVNDTIEVPQKTIGGR